MKRFSACILKILMAVTVLLSVLSLSACKQDDFTVYFGIDSMPVNIDPQLASSYSELLTVRNCFRGLIKPNADGEPVFDTATTMSVSDDGLRYTFTFCETVWSNGDTVTADDYAFAVKRASDPLTKAPHYVLTLNVETVTCSGNTVTYVLKERDDNFLYKLADPVFMPCSSKFFEECCGKYGLAKSYITCNGTYSVSAWDGTSYLVMRRRTGEELPYSTAQRIYLTYSTKGKDSIKRISDGEIGVAVNYCNDYSAVDTAKFNVSLSYKKNFAVIFNPDSAIGSNPELVTAFAKDINRNVLNGKIPKDFEIATGIFPKDSFINGKRLSSEFINRSPGFSYSVEEARAIYLNSLKKYNDKKLPQVSVLTVDSSGIKSALSEIVGVWQSDLGAYINITTAKTEESLMAAVLSGRYDIAFIPFGNDVLDTARLLDTLGIIAFENHDEMSLHDTSAVNTLCEAIDNSPYVIPLISVPTAFISDKSYKNFYFSPVDSTAFFSDIRK